MKLTDTLGKKQRSLRKLFVIFITNYMLFIQVGGGGRFIISFIYSLFIFLGGGGGWG